MKKKKVQIIIIVAILVAIIIVAVTFAKYKSKIKENHQIESTEFFLSSDIANVEGTSNYVEKWDGEEDLEIKFNVSNNENTNLITKEDITYEIEVEKVRDTENQITAEIYDGNKKVEGIQTLAGNEKTTKEYTLKISKNAPITVDSFEIEVKIKSLTTYEKELTGNIEINIVKDSSEISSSISDKGDYVILNIETKDLLENKTIKYDNTKLIVDKTNSLITGDITTNNNINSFEILKENLNKNTEYYINFIKKDTNNEVKLGTDIIIN